MLHAHERQVEPEALSFRPVHVNDLLDCSEGEARGNPNAIVDADSRAYRENKMRRQATKRSAETVVDQQRCSPGYTYLDLMMNSLELENTIPETQTV